MEYVIIGNSAAAVGAVEGIRQVDDAGNITVISEEPYYAYSRPLISYLLAGTVDDKKMAYRDAGFYEDNDVSLLLGVKAVSIDTAGKQVLLSDGKTVTYDRLLIATGGKPFVPPTKGSDKKGVYTFIKRDDAEQLKAIAKPGKKAVVIGGGLIGLKAAEGLVKCGVSVTVVELADRILSTILDEQAAAMVQEVLEEHGINIILNNTVTEVIGDDRASGVILKNGDSIECDMIITAIGVRPNTDVVANTDISINRGIKVDDHMCSDINDVYAAGDVAEAYDIVYEDQRVTPIWPNAYIQGEVAGRNMAGDDVAFDGGFARNSIAFFGLPMITAGIIKPTGDDYEVASVIQPDKKVYKKAVFKDNRLVGFIRLTDIDRAGILTGLIKDKIDVTAFKNKLLDEDFGFVYMPKSYRKEKLLGVKRK
ncbi:NAD(P)/FAD-dependent oxidoreductase [Mahella australiensis]|uniref:FAD-dependent pyridine nucleotide-disulfide oxidoreductase n=1 Tax=Mahella australiensis (strain DSM 15567 / CIP 107919 / 50-1 BON) TaxID=697281 RepID=F4A054_MAHA5|nr:FAD-dependent oxidoreductase [Mahella australiensis]AEE96888.1 FAD-dependent pyridine nucleotide-disulfide oxidoreductase [Mahella australiensis 50-1 BON]